ncbi:hypothetical protein CHLRE_14g614850v5 [Chlamydomonas reinhardtii]|uniref:Flagellar associated protein n=1 Tax=Chlamydomonas reinhardtii TaxID=3055 RepID=A0A2K3CXH6_CHLRE|nr:uncharacterized protein CHLRE_14g614850v5 [Chlamydomonas reinhardtii]PNW72997.1 hypothetical protein CHLRE_14g614850v5 [Chlamydomonas reinhardtii]
MGGACCKSAPEFNPDGSEKDPQSEEQRDQDPADLRRWAKDGDAGEVERLLKRMPRKQIQSGAKKSENPEEEGHTALHFAAARGSLPCVELLVLYGSAVNARGAGGATPLHTALEAGKRQIAHFLLEHGADINATDKSGASPFLAVLVSGRKRLSTWLLQRCGSDLSHGATDKAGLTAAAAVARNGWWDFLEKLAAAAGGEAPTALNTRSAEGDTPLGWALKYGAAGLLSGDVLTGVVNKLLEAGASPMVPAFKEQIPPLCLAAATGSLPVLAALRSKGGELDPAVCVDSLRRNALHYAAAKGHKEMAALLMAEGGPGMAAHVTDAAGNTPLHLAALRGHADVSQTLLEKAEDKSAAILTANREGVSVYHLMLQAGPEDRSQRGVLWILDHISADDARVGIKVKEVVVETPLLMAVASHQDRVVAALLEAGHQPNQAADTGGDIPLSRCLASATADTAAADAAIFKLLIEKGASMESASATCHPLLAICQNPLSRFSEQVVELLAAKAGGASSLDWSAHSDGLGRGPLHLAALHDNAFMVKYLIETAKIDVEAVSKEGLTPLMYAAWGCAPNAMKVLLNRRANPRALSKPQGADAAAAAATAGAGDSVLSYCLQLDRPESLACAAMLLVMGAKPEDVKDGRGEGFIHRAVRYGSAEFIRLWVRYGGNVCLLATTADAADDLPEKLPAAAGGGAGGRRGGPAEDYLDVVPEALEAEEEADDGAWDLGSGRMDGAAAAAAAGSDPDLGKAAAQADADGGDIGGGATIKAHRISGGGDGALAASGFADATVKRPSVNGRGGAYGDAGGDAAEAVESFSLPGGANGASRAVAEAVEAEINRYPSFVRAPSHVEVRAWTRRGAAWFDDALPTVADGGCAGVDGASGFGSVLDACLLPASLPLPPSEEEEEAEEAAEEEEPEIHPAMDADAIWRRMLLDRMKDRRGGGGAAAAAVKRPLAAINTTGVAAERLAAAASMTASPAAGVTPTAAAAVTPAPGGGSFLERITRRRSGSFNGAVPAAASPVAAAAGGGAASIIQRFSGAGASGSAAGSPAVTPRAASGAAAAGRRSSLSGSPAAAAAATARVSGDGGASPATTAFSAAEGEWMAELERSAESVFAALSRGTAADAAVAVGGSGSRAVRGMRASRDGGGGAAAAAADAAVDAAAKRARRVRGPGAVAEGREGGNSSDSDTSDDSENEGAGGEGGGPTGEGKMESALEDLKDAGMGLVSKLMDKRVAITDPYYKKGSKYKGLPKYMDEKLVKVGAVPLAELLALADAGLAERLARYPAPAEEAAPPAAADLRERNIKWYNHSLSPQEYPMKLGQWKSALKKAKAAAAAARLRAAKGPGGKVTVRSRKVWFGLPAMPSRPELRETSALVYAVRLARPACVAALLEASLAPLNLPDGWGVTATAYAAYMVARDKHNTTLQHVYDMLLAKLPQVNYTRLDSTDGNAGHSLLCPINLAIVSGDKSRLAHLVLRCAGAINNSWTLLGDIPTYLSGLWEKAVAKCDSRCPALCLAVLSKRIDMVKLCLDLGANPNVFGESRDLKLKAKLAKEWAEEQERARKLKEEYRGVMSKASLGLMQKLARLKRAISRIEIPGLTKPHGFVTPLHLAARTGQAEVVFLLLRRGALSNGGGSVPYAKYTPLQEAMMYARSNFSATNAGAKRKNWKEVRPALEDLPGMSAEAAKKDADQKANAMLRAFVDPTMMALKAVALAAKYAVNFLMEMRRRPIAHHDPAVWAAHVLLTHRAPYELADTQTGILLRDVMDNGKWKWLRRPLAKKFKVKDDIWTGWSRDDIESLKSDPDIGYPAIRSTPEPKEYRQLKQQFIARCDEAYFGSGGKALHARWQKCAHRLLDIQQKYVYDELMPAIMNLAAQAVTQHVHGSGALLQQTGSVRRSALEASAAALAGGVALDEAGVMDAKPLKAFMLPATLAPSAAGDGVAVAAEAQAAAAAELREAAAAAAEHESWGRVMVWGPAGMFLGFPGEGQLPGLPSGEAELASLGKDLADVDTDELKESLSNLAENFDTAADWMLAKMQDVSEGLSNLLEIIGIDFLDML